MVTVKGSESGRGRGQAPPTTCRVAPARTERSNDMNDDPAPMDFSEWTYEGALDTANHDGIRDAQAAALVGIWQQLNRIANALERLVERGEQ
jgi:hypothetical protein